MLNQPSGNDPSGNAPNGNDAVTPTSPQPDPKFPTSSSSLVDFVQTTERISTTIAAALERGEPLEPIIDRENDSIYLKSADQRLLCSNQVYRRIFTPDELPVGRFGSSFLHKTIIPISEISDKLILEGCMDAIFDHYGRDSEGQLSLFRTAKKSLIGVGQGSFAILGITRVEKTLVDANNEIAKGAFLAEQWRRFNELPELDRQIAISLARGMSAMEIAQEREVSKRTIENHRNSILSELDLGSPLEMIKLLVRLQEKGFGDFGV
ncbi:helix-turn-helix transcriptional regulator [Roseiconus lacunae]|uniref:LuxR C-terminal-related transcriptional regulator n=1 Tax=Roseiconus lacunae TaxID=2605694 RepID=A0ABT7PJN0_9BACT|nr:LuxR C-terminal-related transcriptional regulator [Roseiconus lacunae]MCD0459502.1 LuxR C-terminal-related transcriptional regulator [Roseiconus lacunae]MDM4016712.1 LuxR C-terminal-related transcriptional regulator [Roseiconus lacunae]WRQ50974.1 LuxR C-terminal-related transcriptional regulator [Stieleria sp. HD01]